MSAIKGRFTNTAQAKENSGGTCISRRKSVQDCIKEYTQSEDGTVVESLLDTTENCDIQDKDGKTLLMVAAMKGNTKLVHRLIKTGAAVNVRDNEKRSALFYATSCGYSETVHYLLNHGAQASVNKTDKNSDTPLHVACQLKYCSCVGVLLKHGANPNAYNLKGQTPVSISRSRGNKCTQQMLCSGQPTDIKDDIVYTNFNTSNTRRSKRATYEEIEDFCDDDVAVKEPLPHDKGEKNENLIQTGEKTPRQLLMQDLPNEHDYLDLIENRKSEIHRVCRQDSSRESSYTNWNPYDMDGKQSFTDPTPQHSDDHYNKGHSHLRPTQQHSPEHYHSRKSSLNNYPSRQEYTDQQYTVKISSSQPQNCSSVETRASGVVRDDKTTSAFDEVLAQMTQPKLKKVPPPVKPKPTAPRKNRKSMYENVDVVP